jgi:GNAT superfamily N-acetyltransferase
LSGRFHSFVTQQQDADREPGPGVPPCRMPELTVRVLGEQDWLIYREVRLAAVRESPSVFGDTHDQEAAADQTCWRSELTAARRIIAELDGSPRGVVSVRRLQQEQGSGEAMELFDLWVEPTARSTGVTGRLVETAATLAAAQGAQQLYSWVGTENGPAIGFAIGFGFRITSHRRPAISGDHTLGDTEIALVLPLEDDPHTVPNATTGNPLRR